MPPYPLPRLPPSLVNGGITIFKSRCICAQYFPIEQLLFKLNSCTDNYNQLNGSRTKNSHHLRTKSPLRQKAHNNEKMFFESDICFSVSLFDCLDKWNFLCIFYYDSRLLVPLYFNWNYIYIYSQTCFKTTSIKQWLIVAP